MLSRRQKHVLKQVTTPVLSIYSLPLLATLDTPSFVWTTPMMKSLRSTRNAGTSSWTKSSIYQRLQTRMTLPGTGSTIRPDSTGKTPVKFESKGNIFVWWSRYLLHHRLFQSLHATTFPPGTNRLWLFLIVDREAIESMLRVYGPPAVRTSEFIPLSPRKEDAPFLPYVTAASTRWLEDENTSGSTGEALGRVQEEPQVNDTEYHGQFKCALRSVFRLWENEQLLTPQEYYPRDRKIWGGDHVVYEAPGSLL